MATTRPAAQSYIIKRPRLTRLLDETTARIILLCAPAGYGKTTLAREWVDKQGKDAYWYSTKASAADVAALALDLAELLESISPRARGELGKRVQALAAAGQSAHVLARTLLEEAPAAQSILVIDDYHYADAVESEVLIQDFVAKARFRLVMTSRTRPAWITPRMLIYGDAMLVGASDLSFTEDEAHRVLAWKTSRKSDELLRRAQGWPAVIGLAARQTQANSTHTTLPPQELYDFFADDMFQHTSTTLQEALFVLAAGGDATCQVARDLLGAAFDEVVARGCDAGFLNRDVDGDISIHPLLRSFLLVRLGELDGDHRDHVVRSVVGALSEHHRWDECLLTLQQFPHSDLISQVMTAALNDLLASGRIATVKQWAALARETTSTHPIFLLADAEVALREGAAQDAQTLAEEAGALLSDGEGAARAYLTAARAAHLREEPSAAVSNAARARKLAVDLETQIEALWLMFMHAVEQQTPDAEDLLNALYESKGTGPKHAIRIASAECFWRFESGNVREALRAAERALPLLALVHDPIQRTGCLNVLCYLTLASSQYERTLSLSQQQADEARDAGLEFAIDHAQLTRAGALIGTRKLLAAQRTLEEIQRRSSMTANVATNVALYSARMRIAAGDLSRASLMLAPDPPDSAPPAYHGEHAALQGLVHAAQSRIVAAEESLNRALKHSRYIDAATTALLARAVVLLATKQRRAALEAAESVAQVLEQGHLDAVVTACRAYPALATAAARDTQLISPLTDLFSTSQDVSLGRQAGLDMPREFRRSEGLSPREREVHELLAQGRTNREIAKALFISESTTKVHVRHVFEKLGVHTRAEAAAAWSRAAES